MDTALVTPEATAEPVAPVVETPPEAASIADHQASFGAEPGRHPAEESTEREDRDTQGRFKHRASSQQATAEDVEEINKLTKELRTKEAELRKIKPDAVTGSPRVLALRQRIKAIEADLHESKPAEVKPAPVRQVQPQADTFTDEEPKFEDFANEPDQYAAHVRALARFDRKKEAHDASQQHARTEYESKHRQVAIDHHARMSAAAKARPDFNTVTAPVLDRPLPALLVQAIVRDDKGPDHVYYLGQHPELLDQMRFDAEGKAVTDENVAEVQRRLRQHVQAATTGSAAVARAPFIPPRPPNPVRTGPIKTSDDPPAEATSIADHARYYGPKAR